MKKSAGGPAAAKAAKNRGGEDSKPKPKPTTAKPKPKSKPTTAEPRQDAEKTAKTKAVVSKPTATLTKMKPKPTSAATADDRADAAVTNHHRDDVESPRTATVVPQQQAPMVSGYSYSSVYTAAGNREMMLRYARSPEGVVSGELVVQDAGNVRTLHVDNDNIAQVLSLMQVQEQQRSRPLIVTVPMPVPMPMGHAFSSIMPSEQDNFIVVR